MQSYDTNYKIPHSDLEYGKKLGAGGFGEVFEGTWQHSQVAIKRLKMQKLSPEAYQELETEAKMMAELRHDNIIGFRGFCYESPHYALVMEYMPRGSLYDLLHSSQDIDWQTRVQISMGAGAGLVYLHNKNILHRDIKSLNVLLYDKGNELHAKLTDFGLSKVKTDTKLTTSTAKNSSGTLAWMAPELFARRAKYEKASDIYSFAVMLWEIASRRVPFEDAHDPGLIPGWVKEGEREEIPEGTPELFQQTIESGWKQETKDRPTADQIISSLKLLMQNLPRPTQSNPSPSPNPNPRPLLMSGLQGNIASGAGKKLPAKKMAPMPNSIQGNVGTGSVKMMPKKIVPKQQEAANSVIGNLASSSVEQIPSDTMAPVIKNLPGKLVIKNSPKIIMPLSAQPKGGTPAASFSGAVGNLQSKSIPRPSALDDAPPLPLPSPPQTPSAAEQKLAQQQAEIESLKNSMDALVKMKEQEERRRLRKEEKKKQPTQERREKRHAEAEQLKNLSSNERVNAKAASLAAKVMPAAITELLDYTVRGKLDNVESCLQNNHALVYAQGDITDPAGRSFKKITAFQYAVWALDKEMWQLCLTILPQADAYDQLRAMEYERQDIIRAHGAHFSFDPLLNVYKRYFDNWEAWYNARNWDALKNCWCKEIGGAQKLMPAWFVYLFTEEGEDKAWGTGLRIGSAQFTRSGDTTWGLGVGSDHAVYRDNFRIKKLQSHSFPTKHKHITIKAEGQLHSTKWFTYREANQLAKLKLVRERDLEELTDQLSQAAPNPSTSLRYGKQ